MRARALPLLVLAGCLDPEPRPARWSYLHAAIVQPSCATSGCHSALTAMAGIDLSDHEGAYTMLTGRVCGEPIRAHDPPRNYVTPGSAAYSTLMYQLRGEDRDVMPPDMPLPNAEIVLIGHWIDEGATCE